MNEPKTGGASVPLDCAVMRWIDVNVEMPKPGEYVIAAVKNQLGNWRRIRAMYAAKHTLESCDGEDDCDYDETTDQYFCPEGWYETNNYEEVHYAVIDDVLLWMVLPPLPQAHNTGIKAAAEPKA